MEAGQLRSTLRSSQGGLHRTTFAVAPLTCSSWRCERRLAIEMRSTLCRLARRQLQPARKQISARVRSTPIHMVADHLRKIFSDAQDNEGNATVVAKIIVSCPQSKMRCTAVVAHFADATCKFETMLPAYVDSIGSANPPEVENPAPRR